jgi:flagellin
MGLRVNTNISAMTAQRNLGNVSSRLQGNFARLSSGLRIASAADDAAGLGISERMRADIRSYSVAARNAQDVISLVQTAEGALNEASGILTRMRELSVQAANGTLSSNDRGTLNTEFGQLVSELDRIAGSTNFNGVSLLDGNSSTLSIQVGINAGTNDVVSVSIVDATASTLGVSGLDVSSSSGASSAISAIDSAINTISTSRGTLGAQQNRLDSTLRSILNVRENTSAAESRIRDVDVAYETADLTRNSILQQAATAVLAQANTQPQLALSLLG